MLNYPISMLELNLPRYDFKVRLAEGKQYIFDEIRKKYVVNTPEEWVRQNFIRYLINEKGYPGSLIGIEYEIKLNRLLKRCDAVVFSKKALPVMILEFKAPGVPVSQLVFDQIERYNKVLRVGYLLITNGLKHYCCKIDFDSNNYVYLREIPFYNDLTD